MRYVVISVLFVIAGCAESAPTSTGENNPLLSAGNAAANAVSDAAPPVVFNTQLRAENEPNNASTSESVGTAQVKVFADGTVEFMFIINNKSDETYNRAHIHKAAAGVNGPIHWDFLEAGVPVASLSGQPPKLVGVARPRVAAVLSDLLANPHLYYVNVHSTAFPGGSVRGQLR